MQPVFCVLCALAAVGSGQQQWYTHSTKKATAYNTTTALYPWVTSSQGSWEGEACTMVPADERFLTLNNFAKYNYMVTVYSNCFKQGDIVQVAVWSLNYYTGFIMQAHSVWDWDTTPYGEFSRGQYSEGLKPMTCGYGYNNVMMTYETGYYTNHTFYWHAPYDLQNDIIFNATFINEWEDGGEYSMNVTSEVLEYRPHFDDNVAVAGGNSLKTGGILAILIFIMMEIM